MREEIDAEEPWAAFEARLRASELPEPPPGLRQRCLPPGTARDRQPEQAPGILVVEDQPNIRRLIQVHLERAGYRVDLAADGLEGLAHVAADPPDLIILDVMMPNLDGLRVVERLKSDPRTSEIPVIMLTARSSDVQVREGLLEGADLYLAKPFDPEQLREIVDRMVSLLGTPENPPSQRRWQK